MKKDLSRYALFYAMRVTICYIKVVCLLLIVIEGADHEERSASDLGDQQAKAAGEIGPKPHGAE